MTDINLHTIFQYLVNDDSFLSTILETNKNDFEKKDTKKSKFNLMSNMVVEYFPLALYDLQEYSLFPSKIKNYLSPDYVRFGIQNVKKKNSSNVNVSFLSSLNILLRPDIYKLSINDQLNNLDLLEKFVTHKIQRNYKIDKTKNTKKVQAHNKELIQNLMEGKIFPELIQMIINIFEINLLVFDLNKLDIHLYWTKGTKYPYFNMFKHLYCMSFVKGNYEPIFTLDKHIPKQQIQKIYLQILLNIEEINAYPEIALSLPSLELINSWEISPSQYYKILQTYYNPPPINIKEQMKKLKSLMGKS